MSEAKFTKGPWDRGTSEFTIYSGAKLLANAHWGHGVNGEVARANAHLIAAAPELYEALEWLETYAMVQVDRHPDAQDNKGWRNIIAALAKARGETL